LVQAGCPFQAFEPLAASMMEEKMLFLWSTLPPILAAFWLLWSLRGSPKPMLESLVSIVPGLKAKTVWGSMVCFEIEQSTDVFSASERLIQAGQSQITTMTETMGKLASLTKQGRFGEASQRAQKAEEVELIIPSQPSVREVWVNLTHLVRASCVPIIFVSLYFWDMAVLNRRASSSFPLMHCLDGADCFYIAEDYAIWRWPHYQKLDCDSMRAQTITSKTEFFFQSPPGAKFFKCYTWNASFSNVIQNVGDCFALSTLAAILILYFCVNVTSVANVGNARDLRRHQRRCRIYQVVLGIIGLASAISINWLYAMIPNLNFFSYLGMPGLCVFGIILLSCREEILGQRIWRSENAESSESSDSSAYC